MPRFSLYGCYMYDPTLFDSAQMPAGCDKDSLINVIMAHCGQLYPYHQVPAQLKLNIDFWFKRNYFNFSRMFQAINSDFNPVENYDRYEDRSTSESSAFSESNSSYSSDHSSMSDSSTHSESQLHDVSAYDASTYQPSDRNNIAGRNDATSATNGTNAQNASIQNATNRNYHESAHIHGNIGVMEASTMVQHTIDLYAANDIYKKIAEMFEKEFILQIY